MGLRLKEQKGPRHSPQSWSQRAGDLTREPSSLPGLKWVGQMPSTPAPLVWGLGGPLPPASPDLPSLPPMPPRTHTAWRGFGGQGTGLEAQQAPIPEWVGQSPSAPHPLLLDGPSHLFLMTSPASLLCPQDPCGLEGALDCRGPAWELSRLPGPQWAGQSPSTPLLLFPQGPSHLPLLFFPRPPSYAPKDPCGLDGALEQGNRLGSSAGCQAPVGQVITLCSSPTLPRESLPPASPDLPSLRGADLVWLPVLLSPQSPYVLPVHSGVPPISLGIRVPQQWLAGALVVGRC